MATILLPLASALAALLSSPAASDATVESVRVKAFESVQRIRSVRFDAAILVTEYDRAGFEVASSRFTLNYHGQGDQVRREVKPAPDHRGEGRAEPPTIIRNLDERNHYFNNVHYSILLDPLVVPYLFLFEEVGAATWPAVADESVWKARFEEARLVKTVKDGDLTLDVIEFPCPASGCDYEVYFARELNSFPIVLTRKVDGAVRILSSVRERWRADDARGSAIVPLFTVFKTLDEAGGFRSLQGEIRLAPDSIEVNPVTN